ncbi:hypothetical protein ACRJ4B_47770 [Streptomyces sp. GTA36]
MSDEGERKPGPEAAPEAEAGAEAGGEAGAEAGADLGGERRTVSDPAALKALAHPLRLKVLRHLAVSGPATSTTLAAAPSARTPAPSATTCAAWSAAASSRTCRNGPTVASAGGGRCADSTYAGPRRTR